ncbi:SDR family oxidoreductase [Paraburkholderia silvatlantica]|uniref:Oxidoreductase n=1 Tax=Paraburkholderia silvatlantica TaxID=321895 RepID=A0ABR6FP66_9BURK|nr:SDR family NAD(P)-dependent oxidoreductase [Paraburkholderia silvatlantica]MBB2929210.1 putative oxidoreductase [Paraburkholderia silvatlantica]PVY27240.1 putative oxidoreductase [Paraburkholderia silvatlantica]PXW34269.1 putative oxidoreductase [Paraburkholderia silvatlantica]TDQ85164.1 putative oxidoreductase [Paraburkholderia silvatlantica]
MEMIGRTVLITGGTSGIGLELAKQLAARGNTVIVTGRSPERLQAAREAIPGLHAFRSDVSDLASIESLYKTISDRFPLLDTLVNNAGTMRNIKLGQQYSLNDLTTEIDGNVKGPIWMVQAFLPLLVRRKGSLIVNVSSGLAFIPFPAAPIYSASKAALHAYTQCLRAQLEGSCVSIVELAPPGTETPLFRGEFAEEMKGERGMDVSVLVKRTIAGIDAGKTEIRPGASNVLKIASRVAPHFMFRQLVKLGRPRSSAGT